MSQPSLSYTLPPVDITHLKPEDLGRRVAAVHVIATCERYSYLSAPRRRISWHIFLKLSGGRSGETGRYDAVEVFQLFADQHYFRTAVSAGTSPADALAVAGDRLLCASLPYPDYEASGSLDELRFLCALMPESLVTVREVVGLFSAAKREVSTVSGTNDNEYAGMAVGGMAWCVDAIRALQTAQLLTPTSVDKLMTEFEGSKYRWELIQGSTIIV